MIFWCKQKKTQTFNSPELRFLGHLLDCQVANATGQKVCLLDHLVWKLSAPQRICVGRVIPSYLAWKRNIKSKRSRKQMNPFTRLNCRVSSISNCLRCDLDPNWEFLSISIIYEGWYERRHITWKVFKMRNRSQWWLPVGRGWLVARTGGGNSTYFRMLLVRYHALQTYNTHTWAIYVYGMPMNDICLFVSNLIIWIVKMRGKTDSWPVNVGEGSSTQTFHRISSWNWSLKALLFAFGE